MKFFVRILCLCGIITAVLALAAATYDYPEARQAPPGVEEGKWITVSVSPAEVEMGGSVVLAAQLWKDGERHEVSGVTVTFSQTGGYGAEYTGQTGGSGSASAGHTTQEPGEKGFYADASGYKRQKEQPAHYTVLEECVVDIDEETVYACYKDASGTLVAGEDHDPCGDADLTFDPGELGVGEHTVTVECEECGESDSGSVVVVKISEIKVDLSPGHILATPLEDPIEGEEQEHVKKTYEAEILPEGVIDDDLIRWSVSDETKAEIVGNDKGPEVTLKGKSASNSVGAETLKVEIIDPQYPVPIALCSESKDFTVVEVQADAPEQTIEGYEGYFMSDIKPDGVGVNEYEWLADWPDDVGNNPQVTFKDPTAVNTWTEKARWFANPDTPDYIDQVEEICDDIVCTYEIAVAAIVDGARILSESRDWEVRVI